LLPNSIIDRTKLGFPTPWAQWLAGDQLNSIESMLTEPRTVERGLTERAAVQKLFSEHRAGQRENGNRIWRLLNLEIWQRVFIDREAHSVISDPLHAATAPNS
jgi:asparagine synthase (glutamine-hydrolysing)